MYVCPPSRDSCSIADTRNELLYLTGHCHFFNGSCHNSSHKSSQVTQYSFNGSRVDLPDLNTGRYDHACSGYYNQQDQFVLLVVGGRTSPIDTGEGGSPLLI